VYTDDRLTDTCLMAFYQDNLGKPAPERLNQCRFNEATDDGVAVASSGPYSNYLHLATDRQMNLKIIVTAPLIVARLVKYRKIRAINVFKFANF